MVASADCGGGMFFNCTSKMERELGKTRHAISCVKRDD